MKILLNLVWIHLGYSNRVIHFEQSQPLKQNSKAKPQQETLKIGMKILRLRDTDQGT